MPAAPFSSAHTVLSGTTSLIAGSGTLLTGDYGFRGLYSFTTTSAMPSDYENDSVGYVDLARFGDFALRCRRQVGTVYEVRAEFLTAAAVSTWASAFISVENDTPASVGLGVVRDSTTGTISILRSVGDMV
jgi:hypothetical protein